MVRDEPSRRKRRLPDEFGIPNEEIRYAIGDSVLGPVLVASSDRGVVAILIGENPDLLARNLQKQLPRGHLVRDDGAGAAAKVIAYIDEPEGVLEIDLDLRGTDFQKKVWRAIQNIPAGATASYSDIAVTVGVPRAGRAVGTVCAANTLAFAVPCHRVLRKDGMPRRGPHWGHSQTALLRREGSAPK